MTPQLRKIAGWSRCGRTIGVLPGVRYAKCPACRPFTLEQRAADYAKRKARWQERLRTEPFLREHVRLEKRVSRCLLRGIEDPEVVQALGCRVVTARGHIERQFKPGMTWATHATHWQIDHKKPKNWFYGELLAGRMSEDEYRRRVHHYTNLRPMWIRDNLYQAWKAAQAA
jgi:hypothetical protein